MRRFETWLKYQNKYVWLGWYPLEYKNVRLISTKTRQVKSKEYVDGKWLDGFKTYVYKTYEYPNGEIKTYKYGAYVDD